MLQCAISDQNRHLTRYGGSASPLSVSRKINREIVVLLGWAPAILCQFAHPLVAAGVADHSRFYARIGERPRRFHKTVEAMLALTFGTPDQVLQAASEINAIHDRVHGSLRQAAGPFPAGAEYSAHDPELLRWVHATLLDTLPRTYELFVGPLADDEKDRYCAEASHMGPLLGIPDGLLPSSMAELRDYVDDMLRSGEIVAGSTARELARELLWPALPSVAHPLVWFAQLPTIGLLPPPIREAYGFTWDARQDAALGLSARVMRLLLRWFPPMIRHWPAARRADGKIGRFSAGHGRAAA